jgi:HEAT repeat protein
MARKHTLALLALWAICIVAAAPAHAQSLDEAFAALPGYKLGDSRKPLEVINQEVTRSHADAQARSALAARLAAVLGSDASPDAKDFVLRQLYITATRSEIPAVARLLTDERMSHMARYVLEAMAMSEADGAMRAALGQVQGKLRIGMINSLGNRRDSASAPLIIRALDDAEAGPAAATALGKIATPEAIAALRARLNSPDGALKDAAADAYLLSADALLAAGKASEAAAIYQQMREGSQPQRVQIAGLRGLVQAEPGRAVPLLVEILKGQDAQMAAVAGAMAREIAGTQVTTALASALPTLPASGQLLLIDALHRRGDPAGRSAVLAAARSQDAAIAAAAVKAVGALGNASDVPMLVGLIASGPAEQQAAAREALATLKGQDVDAAVLRAMESASGQVRIDLIKTLSARQASSASASLLKIAASDGADANRVAALEALGVLAGEPEYPQLVRLLVAARTDPERSAASNALIATSQRFRDREQSVDPIVGAMASASPEGKVLLIGALSRVGGDRAIGPVRTSARDGDSRVQEAAIRALTQWPDSAALPDLFALAKSADQKQQVLAVRGLVRIVGIRSNRSSADSLKLYQQILDVASRPDEKKLVINGISDIRDAAAYEMITPFLADRATANEAASAIIKVAGNLRNNPRDRDRTNAALDQVAGSAADDSQKKRAVEAKIK